MITLTREQQEWCAAHGIGQGYDDDNPDLHQFCHLVEETGERRPLIDAPGDYAVNAALCRSTRLWFGAGPDHRWPWTAKEDDWPFMLDCTDENRQRLTEAWCGIDCEGCIRILFERGCPR